MKLTDEQRKIVEKHDERSMAKLNISVMANELFPFNPDSVPWWVGIGMIISIMGSVGLLVGVVETEDWAIIPGVVALLATIPVFIGFWQMKKKIKQRENWERQALDDWEKTGELPN
jgi:hypothetical protein